MTKNVKTIIILAFMVLTFLLWLVSMVTPGWLVFDYGGGPSFTKKVRTSIFYIKVCTNGHDWEYLSPKEYSKDLTGIDSLYLLESQIQSVVALVLCVTSSILVIIQLTSTSKNLLFFVIILLPVAATLEGVLILEMILANIRFISLMPLEEKLRWYFPYSILLSGLGTLFAIVSWVVAFVVHHVQSRKQDCQTPYLRMEETRDCPITEQSSEKE